MATEGVEFWEHTADVGMRVRAQSLDALFRRAAEGLFDYIVANREPVEAKSEADVETVELSAVSLDELLAVWLNELIFRFETRHRVYGAFETRVEDEGPRAELRATIAGEAIDGSRHEFDHEVKAVTRHGLSVRREGSGWLAEAILDI